MSVSPEDFRVGMRQLGAAVNVVTTHNGGRSYGLTATAVCSVTAEPPRLLACINKTGITFKSIQESGSLVVNTLCAEHKELAEVFAGMGGNAEDDRFHIGNWEHLEGIPVLADALVSFICDVEDIQDVGSHGIILANIKSIITGQGEPLFYFDGDFMSSRKL